MIEGVVNIKNILGNVYGDMKVLSYEGKTQNHIKLFKVSCVKCGNEKIIQYARLNSLVTCFHSNKSCGIYLEEHDEHIGMIKNDYVITRLHSITKQGYRYFTTCNVCGMSSNTYISNFKRGWGTKHESCTHHIKKTKYIKRFRKIYSCMRQRTANPNYSEFHLYGGRGINSDYFSDFMVFYKDMYNSYCKHVDEYGEKDTSIDRIDVNGNYKTSNCRWVTNKEQANNKRIHIRE